MTTTPALMPTAPTITCRLRLAPPLPAWYAPSTNNPPTRYQDRELDREPQREDTHAGQGDEGRGHQQRHQQGDVVGDEDVPLGVREPAPLLPDLGDQGRIEMRDQQHQHAAPQHQQSLASVGGAGEVGHQRAGEDDQAIDRVRASFSLSERLLVLLALVLRAHGRRRGR